MRKCLFVECRRRPGQNSGRISFHSFPSEASFVVKWVTWIREACGKCDFVFHHSSSFLCSRHFTNDCFRRSRSRSRLQRNALPTITPDDLDNAENISSNIIQNYTEKEEIRQNIPPSHLPRGAEDLITTATNNVSHPDVLVEKHHEITDLILEVHGDGEGLIPTPQSAIKKKYLTDFSTDDFKTCQKAKRNLNILKTALRKTRKRLHAQAGRILIVKKSVSVIGRLIQNLANEQMITDEAKSELGTAVNKVLDHINCKNKNY